MTVRYLHINTADNVFVSTGETVSRGELIGKVGSRGYVAGTTRYNHLHLDSNSEGLGSMPPTTENYIPPEYFWPDTFVDVTDETMWVGSSADWEETETSPASISSTESTDCSVPTMSEILAAGQYFDIELIRYLGVAEFEEWLRLNPSGSIIDVMEHFDLTLEDLQQIVVPRIYDLCVDYVSQHS